MSKTNPNIPQSQSKIVPPYIPPPKPTVRTIPLHIADAAVAACEKEIQELRAEVERLRKAGDKLAGGRTHTFTKYGKLIEDPIIVEWNAAKEGKQP